MVAMRKGWLLKRTASLPFLTNSLPSRPHLSSARVLRPTTLFATLVCAAEIWSLCRALVALGISASSLRGTWDSILSPSGRDATRKSLRKTWALTFTLILPPRMPQRPCSVWAGPERFSQQPPVVMLWDHLCPVLPCAASSSSWVYRGPDPTKCVPACFWRAVDLRKPGRHCNRYRRRACLQRPGEYPPDDRDSSSRAGC